jgi:Mrp family chromosome partitioning ATPase
MRARIAEPDVGPEDESVPEPETPVEIEESVRRERGPEDPSTRRRVASEKEADEEPVAIKGEETVASDEPAGGEHASGTVGLAEIIAGSAVRVALFAGAEGGEGAGAIAFSTAREAAKRKVRCVLVDVGREPSDALGNERPGLVDLLAGDASFGEVIQRDDAARVHVIPLGLAESEIPMQRMQMVVGALTHTYDKVIVVADNIDDWPDEHVKPDIAAIVCGPETSESLRTEVYDVALARGAHSAVIVRYSDFDLNGEEKSAAA